MPPKGKYTDPELREEVKEEVKESDKGGAPGQWSARKAQMMASEYKKRGGDYTTNKETGQDDSQKNLSKWGDEEWQTKEGSGEAKNDDGSRKRYLPKKAWEQMTEGEKEETEKKKEEGGKEGKQFVSNTDTAKEKRKEVNEKESGNFDEGDQTHKQEQPKGKGSSQAKKNSGRKNKQAAQEEEDEERVHEDESEPGKDEEDDNEDDENDDQAEESGEGDSGYDSAEKKTSSAAKSGDKRGRSTEDSGKSDNKKQKSDRRGATHGSKHDSAEEPAQKGSAGRLPKEGQRVSWKAMPGWVHGVLKEIIKESTTVEGKGVKASKDDPRFLLEADSGKTCVHKPETCYYD